MRPPFDIEEYCIKNGFKKDYVPVKQKIVDLFNTAGKLPLNQLREHKKTIKVLNGAKFTGVYGLYYIGEAPLYGFWKPSYIKPIFIAKANSLPNLLFKKLDYNYGDISAAQDLELNDFLFTYIRTNPLYAEACETMLVDEFKPLWNKEGYKLAFGSIGHSLWKQYHIEHSRKAIEDVHIHFKKMNLF